MLYHYKLHTLQVYLILRILKIYRINYNILLLLLFDENY
jgi:predicted SPOUT superfamily RNA methylase MTH1